MSKSALRAVSPWGVNEWYRLHSHKNSECLQRSVGVQRVHWRTATDSSCSVAHPDSASAKAITVPLSLFGEELINIPLRQGIVNSLVDCVLCVELMEGEKLLMCVEVVPC